MAQTLPNGVVVPNADGGESISATGVQEMRTLGSSVDTALADARFIKGRPPSVSSSLFDLAPGVWSVPYAGWMDTLQDLPPGERRPGVIVVHAVEGELWKEITFHPTSEQYYWRATTNTSGSGMTTWEQWDNAPNTILGNLPENRNWDNYYLPGTYRVTGSGSLADRGHTNFPPEATTSGFLTITNGIARSETLPWAAQTYTQFGATRHIWWRVTRSAVSGIWGEWERLSNDPWTPNAGLTNQVLREQMARRRGGTIGIGAKGALVLRFDHGLNAFRSDVVPLLRKWNLPSCQAYLSEMFEGTTSAPDESDLSSWTEVREWARNAGVEPMAHSATHFDAPTLVALKDEIIGCRDVLSTSIPESAIESWAVPGGGGTEYMGFNDGNEPDRFTDTTAGNMLLATYAFSMGHIGGAEWILNGQAPQGSRHSTVDSSQALNAARTNIQRAIDHRTGYVVMLHPRLLGSSSESTTLAELDDFLGYVAGLRDAGQLEVMTLGGMVHAKSGDNRRLNLLNAGHFPEDWASVWGATSGYARLVENGVGFVRTSSTARITQTILNRRVTPHRGAMFEIAATVRTTTSGTVRLEIPAMAGVSRDFAMTATQGWHEVRQFVTFPLNASDNYEVHVGRVTGSVDILNVRVQPI